MPLPMYQHKMDLIPKIKKNKKTVQPIKKKKKEKEMTAKSLKKGSLTFQWRLYYKCGQ